MKSKHLFQIFILLTLFVAPFGEHQPVRASTSPVGLLDNQDIGHNFPGLQDEPSVSLIVNPSSVHVDGTANVTVRLNHVPVEGYTSAELTCTYSSNLVDPKNIVITNRFGPDPAVAISNYVDHFIVAIAGSHGNKATTDGVVMTFDIRARQPGQASLDCQARVSKGDNVLTTIASTGANIMILAATVTPTIKPTSCDRAEFIADINVPPGTVMPTGTQFMKTWRLKNVGSCTWTTSYRLAFFSGEQMGAPSSIRLSQSVEPGQTVDISLNMTAPPIAGAYRGYWIFQNATGQPFGIGSQGNEPWFVDMLVSTGVTPGPTFTPTATQTSIPCYQAELTGNVNIPPGTLILPGAAFTQSWELRNTGSCTWTPAYQLVFNAGEYMDAPLSSNLPSNVAPGQSVVLSLNFIAPVAIGRHIGFWKIRPAPGVEFGVGPSGRDPLKVDIMVALPTATPGGPTATPMVGVAYDFAVNVCVATWSSGMGQLPCPGIDGDAKGFVRRVDNPKLETGGIDPRPSLLTFPQNVQGGYIQGSYPPFHVLNGDRFRSTLTCEFGATECEVSFRLDYQVGGDPIKTFWGPFHEPYDGRLDSVDVDLSPLAGKDVKFILTVLKPGYRTGDRALWVGPIIYRSDLIATATPTLTPTATYTPVPSSTPPTSSNYIKVTSPNGGEVLMAGSTYRITWDSTSDIKTVYIGYKWSDTGMDWIVSGIPNTGYYDWYVGWPPFTQLKIFVSGFSTAGSDESDGFVTIFEPTPTAAPSGILTGQVFASKPVTLELYDLDDKLITSVLANADGIFSLTAPAGQYAILASASGHLDTLGSATIIGGTTSTQPPTKLLAGDVNGDTYIDQFDALTIGMNYNTAVPAAADLNNDGIINVLDLERLAKNYRKMGPVIWYGS